MTHFMATHVGFFVGVVIGECIGAASVWYGQWAATRARGKHRANSR